MTINWPNSIHTGGFINLSQNQKDTLTSLIFNVGICSIKNWGIDGSQRIKKLNSGNFEDMAEEWKEYRLSTNPNTGEKELSDGLVRRWADELEIFFSGDYTKENNGTVN
jgi:GH24 family phage-related lysozyme (muramidase)